MVDYARESSLDLYDVLYEIDDIMDIPAFEEVGGETKPMTTTMSGGSGNNNSDNNKSDDNKPTDNSGNKPTDAASNNPGSTTPSNDDKSKSPNKNLKSATNFVATLKRLSQNLDVNLKKMIQKLSLKITKLSNLGLTKFLASVSQAKTKTKLNEIKVINNNYDYDKFNQGLAKIKEAIDMYNNKTDGLFNTYDRLAAGTEDNITEQNDIVKFNEEYGDDKFYQKIADQLDYNDSDNANYDTIKTNFQSAFRGGEKQEVTINQEYVDRAIRYLQNMGTVTERLTEVVNVAKNISKKVNDKTSKLTANPDTNGELNKTFAKFMENIAKFDLFAVNFTIFACNLATEACINAKFVCMRAYNMNNDGEVNKQQQESDKAKEESEKNTEENTEEKNEGNDEE